MGTIVTRRRIIWRTGAVATADGRTWRNIIWRRRPTAELIIISLHGAVATADGVAARLTRTVILAFALSLSVFFAIGLGFGTASIHCGGNTPPYTDATEELSADATLSTVTVS